MQIQSYNLSNLPNELVKEIIPYLKAYKTYTALACCTKRFNEIAKQYSIISWPIKITTLNELAHVSTALHHLGCDILAVNQTRKIEGTTRKIYEMYGSIYELLSGKYIDECMVVSHSTYRNLEFGLDFPYKSSNCMEEESSLFLTDGYFHDQFRRDEVRQCDIEESYGPITITKEGKETQTLRSSGKPHLYSEKNGYLIYEKSFDSDDEKILIVHEVDSNKTKFSCTLKKNERFHRFIYNEASDHLVFSTSNNYEYPKFSIYEVSSGKLLKKITTMNSFLEYKSLLLYLPLESLIISADKNVIQIFDLKSEKFVRRIPLKNNLPIEQLSFRNNSLYITQNDVSKCGSETPNCIISKIDFYKAKSAS